MSLKGNIRAGLRLGAKLPGCIVSRAMRNTSFGTRFSGHYVDRASALSAAGTAPSYDDESIVDVSFDVMCKRTAWDYPVIFWLSQILPLHSDVLDVGGHLGTKFIAFLPLLDCSNINWTVYELPATVRVALARQQTGALPSEIEFIDDLGKAGQTEVLLASGLLQYLDISIAQLLGSLRNRPKFMILNKVALSDLPSRYTLERIGTARVPYQIRNKQKFEQELHDLKYRIVDDWRIPSLDHEIPTHPWLTASESGGFVLERVD